MFMRENGGPLCAKSGHWAMLSPLKIITNPASQAVY